SHETHLISHGFCAHLDHFGLQAAEFCVAGAARNETGVKKGSPTNKLSFRGPHQSQHNRRRTSHHVYGRRWGHPSQKSRGNGTFQHTDTDPSKPLPKPIFGEGSWQAQRLVSFKTIGVYGVGVAGVLKMEIILVPNNGEPAIPATLEVVCNIPPGNLFTGKAEGYTLTPKGAPFGSFAALVPPIGVTWFTNTVEQRR
ncbi:MAG: hypothetical protein ACE5GN_03755, partial [Waddliaceae bacterium]